MLRTTAHRGGSAGSATARPSAASPLSTADPLEVEPIGGGVAVDVVAGQDRVELRHLPLALTTNAAGGAREFATFP
jgi:hypothetical protein